jgi:hypothetical protein
MTLKYALPVLGCPRTCRRPPSGGCSRLSLRVRPPINSSSSEGVTPTRLRPIPAVVKAPAGYYWATDSGLVS